MSTTVAPPVSEAPAPAGRDRVRLLALGVLVAFWLLPWPEMELISENGDSALYAAMRGAERTGAPGALGLLAMWGLGVAALLARSVQALRVGAALTEALVAAGASVLLILEHPWIPAGSLHEAWAAVFVPLCLLALLDAWATRADPKAHAVSGIRAVAAFLAAVCFIVANAWIPAGIAAWLSISPLAFVRVARYAPAKRLIEMLILLATLAHGASQLVQKELLGIGAPVGSSFNLPMLVWAMAAALVAITAIDGITRSNEAD